MRLSLKFVTFMYTSFGVWLPDHVEGRVRVLLKLYSLFSYTWTIGAYITIQVGELCQVWGNLPLMTAVLFLLSSNVCQSVKVFNAAYRKDVVKKMTKEFDQVLNENKHAADVVERFEAETDRQLYTYLFLSGITIVGWFLSTKKGQLLFRAWYPYDVTKSPAYELTFAHQCIALPITALINISSDTLVTTLIAQCRCRMNLVALSLTTLCDGMQVTEKGMLSHDNEELVVSRLKRCALQHEACLNCARHIEEYFSVSILVQFCVSMVIICVSAYQLAFATTNLANLIGMAFYLIVMAYQVFIYCYQGNELLLESQNISNAAYFTLWYACSVRLRRSLAIIMTRARRAARLTAGGFTVISLSCFTSIIKASYSFFTVLQQVEG